MVATDYNKLLPLGKWITDRLNAIPGGRSVTWLAERVGVDKGYISRIINSYKPINVTTRQTNIRMIREIGKVLGNEIEALRVAGIDRCTIAEIAVELGASKRQLLNLEQNMLLIEEASAHIQLKFHLNLTAFGDFS